uniref:Uncharacterized protein n=1 Tax=Anguilla anguilla TaxID=7936 RepID=A0A0E9PC37_ANGAN
MNGLTIKLYL